jgi:hypothetical protein
MRQYSTIGALRSEIQEATGLLSKDHVVTLPGSRQLMADSAKILQDDAPANTVIVSAFQLHYAPAYEIRVTGTTGRVGTFQVNHLQTAGDLKIQIHDWNGIAPEQQRLMHDGKDVYGSATFSDLDITEVNKYTSILRDYTITG